MIAVKELLETLENTDRIKIAWGDKILFAGFKGLLLHEGPAVLPPEFLDAKIVAFRAVPELRAKDWKERGLMEPLQPEQTPDYRFSDLEMKLYYTIRI